jgi:hypothetical protein
MGTSVSPCPLGVPKQPRSSFVGAAEGCVGGVVLAITGLRGARARRRWRGRHRAGRGGTGRRRASDSDNDSLMTMFSRTSQARCCGSTRRELRGEYQGAAPGRRRRRHSGRRSHGHARHGRQGDRRHAVCVRSGVQSMSTRRFTAFCCC